MFALFFIQSMLLLRHVPLRWWIRYVWKQTIEVDCLRTICEEPRLFILIWLLKDNWSLLIASFCRLILKSIANYLSPLSECSYFHSFQLASMPTAEPLHNSQTLKFNARKYLFSFSRNLLNLKDELKGEMKERRKQRPMIKFSSQSFQYQMQRDFISLSKSCSHSLSISSGARAICIVRILNLRNCSSSK